MNEKNIYLLSNQSYEGVTNLPVISINYFSPKLNLSSYEALIFSSKNGVIGLDKLDQNWKNIPAFCIGEGTSSVVKKLGGKVAFLAQNSYGDEFAKEMAPQLKDKKALFLRGKIVLSKLEDILQDLHVKLDSVVIYETTCKESELKLFPLNSIFIFTSPSTIECFLQTNEWQESYKAICIGEVTAKYLPTFIKPIISEKQSIPECIKLAHSIS